MGTAVDEDIADHAKAQGFSLISADQDFGNVLNYPPADFQGIVLIRPPSGAKIAVILRLVDQFLQEEELIKHLVGRLVLVEAHRIRVRPPI